MKELEFTMLTTSYRLNVDQATGQNNLRNCNVIKSKLIKRSAELNQQSNKAELMTGEPVLSKRPVIKINVDLFFLLSYFRPIVSFN